MKEILLLIIGAMLCGVNVASARSADELKLRLLEVVDHAPGVIGVAFVSDSDTVTVNNSVRYAMMSVFKMHQALAVAHILDAQGRSLDSLIHVSAGELDHDTWSPMLKKYPAGDFDISVRGLVDYAVSVSDNNASNLLFRYIAPPSVTDSIVRAMAADTTFAIAFSEAEMSRMNELSYANFTSPLSAALLIRQVYTQPLLAEESLATIRASLAFTSTGVDRIAAGLQAAGDGVSPLVFGHKTGSGYRNSRNELMAHNDVAYVRLPDGRDYSLAVFVKDFGGTEAEASTVIAAISRIVSQWME